MMKNVQFALPIAALCLTLLTACSETVVQPITPGKTNARPNAPSDAIAELISENQIKVSWQDNSLNENGFLIARGDKKFGWVTIDTLQTNQETYTDVFDPLIWHLGLIQYLLCAYNGFGISEPTLSNEVRLEERKAPMH